MRRLLLAAATLTALATAPAMAADLRKPVYKAPPPPPPIFTWTGFYLGGNFGGAWPHRNVSDTLFGLTFDSGNNNGVFIGGGQLGFNAQFGNAVLGIEWDFDWAAKNNNTPNGVIIPTIGTFVLTSNNRWITTVAARFGLAYDHWLFYGKAGGGWIGNNNFTVTNVTNGASITGLDNGTDSGWLVGAGIEFAFTDNWTAKIEYGYLGLSSRTFIVPAGFPVLAGDTFTTGNRNVQMLKVGLNYLFSWGYGGLGYGGPRYGAY